MRRTNIYLSEAEQQALDARAAVEGCTMSDIVRSVLDRDLNLDDETEIDATFGEFAAELAVAARALTVDDPDLRAR